MYLVGSVDYSITSQYFTCEEGGGGGGGTWSIKHILGHKVCFVNKLTHQTCKIDKPSINKRRNKRLTEIECFVKNVSIFGFTERERVILIR